MFANLIRIFKGQYWVSTTPEKIILELKF